MPRLSNFTVTALFLLFVLTAQVNRAQEREPSREPVLRIETGMHTAAIKRIGVDAANRYLVTASEDKTVRVWELPAGRLLRVIRPALGRGDEGKLYAVTISPDGSTIAAAGWTGISGDKDCIYLFDRESGRLVRRLVGLPEVVTHLAYSPDGRYLAATLGEKNGVRVYLTSTYSPAGEDTDYGDSSYGAEFDRTNRLATTSDDGFIRLYAPPIESAGGRLRLIAKQSAAQGKQPYAVSFSPDGSRLAVGFDDSTQVAVLSARDLSLLYAPDTSGVNNGNLGSVAWSADGRTLYAGGTYYDAIKWNSEHINSKFIRTWADGGRGSYRDIAGAAASTIFHILPLRDGGVIYGASDPAFGALDASGRRTLFVTGAIADYRNNQQGFLLAADGAGVGFAYEVRGNSPARFSLSERKLEAGGESRAGWRAPVTESPGLRVTEWHNTYEPKLNGTRLKLEPYERSRSLAIAPDASAFLLGTDYTIRLFDRNGAERWNAPVPGAAWAVNISADGRLAVAAYGDGTIRWYRMTDGKELLAFFPHKDRKRWILWTPSGYYDASPGAEDLIGWHVNNGRDAAADFFPVGQFRSTYYRPDVVAKILTTGDEQLALKQANEEAGRKQQQASIAQQLPPVVEIISPADSAAISSTEVTVRFRVRTPSGEPVTNIKALVDSRPPSATRELVQQGAEAEGARELRVTVPERDSEVSIIAENRFAPSVPATIRLRWNGVKVSSTKPTLYILAVGVSKYANEKYDLQFADKDARDFVNTMAAQKGLQYKDVVIYHGKALTNESATKDEIEDGLDWIRKQTTSNDVAMVFFSGHGLNDQSHYYFFCPYNIDLESLLRTGVRFSDIESALSAVKGKVVFFVDSCHSGNSLGTGWQRDMNFLINELSSALNGVLVLSASTSSELAYEKPDVSLGMPGLPEWNNGAFTKAVIEAINGAAESRHTGRITYASLIDYVTDRVAELTNNHQHPALGAQAGQNLSIALKR
jgi:WD40 repeat protein